jgi:hypothetical protein
VGGVLPRINIGADVWGESNIMTGVYERWCSSTLHIRWGLCDCLCLVLVCRGRFCLGGVFLHLILGSRLGGVGPVGQEQLGPSYFFISIVLGPLNSLVWYVPSLRYTRGLGWRIHCGIEVTESSTNKQHHLSLSARPSKQPCMVGSTLGVYSFGLIFVSARTNKRLHHCQFVSQLVVS